MLSHDYYVIKIKEYLDPHWADRFGGLNVTPSDDLTTIAGFVTDQAALHGLLAQIRDWGLTLLSVERHADSAYGSSKFSRDDLP